MLKRWPVDFSLAYFTRSRENVCAKYDKDTWCQKFWESPITDEGTSVCTTTNSSCDLHSLTHSDTRALRLQWITLLHPTGIKLTCLRSDPKSQILVLFSTCLHLSVSRSELISTTSLVQFHSVLRHALTRGSATQNLHNAVDWMSSMHSQRRFNRFLTVADIN